MPPEVYTCPDGATVKGAQTNEAPLRYLLNKYPETTDAICIVTQEAEGAFDDLGKVLAQDGAKVKLKKIPVSKEETFSQAILPQILKEIQQGDQILLETTGGFRHAVMDLMLLTRVLSYVGVKTVCAVYSNYQTKRIEDISEQVRMFDLVGGMQELASFGSARTLRTYYGDHPEEKIQELLTSLENLNESVTLCRTGMIDVQIQAFNQALKRAEQCRDPLICSLIPAFRSKFKGCAKETPGECQDSQSKNIALTAVPDNHTQLDIIGLICWYVDSDMMQQAMTVYTERIPKVIFDYLVDWDKTREKGKKKQEHEDLYAAQLTEGLARLSDKKRGGRKQAKAAEAWVSTLKEFGQLVDDSGYTVKCASLEDFERILRDYLWVKTLRNMSNHASADIDEKFQILEDYLAEYQYPSFHQVKMKELRETILQAMERLRTQIAVLDETPDATTDANK